MNIKNLGANQTELSLNDNVTILFSYQTPVAAWYVGGFFCTNKKYSKTTTRHINKWLNGAKAELKDQSFFDGLVK